MFVIFDLLFLSFVNKILLSVVCLDTRGSVSVVRSTWDAVAPQEGPPRKTGVVSLSSSSSRFVKLTRAFCPRSRVSPVPRTFHTRFMVSTFLVHLFLGVFRCTTRTTRGTRKPTCNSACIPSGARPSVSRESPSTVDLLRVSGCPILYARLVSVVCLEPFCAAILYDDSIMVFVPFRLGLPSCGHYLPRPLFYVVSCILGSESFLESFYSTILIS